ncbi:MAG TPA: acyl carrier protein [Micromonosporaceae bacterium]|nr:acyl carrier protein [Micromonosporaceae bacterium]
MIDEVRGSVIDALLQMNFDVSDVTGDTILGPAGLDLDSLVFAELSVQLEDTYGVRFRDEEIERLATMTLDELAAEVALRVRPALARGQSD